MSRTAKILAGLPQSLCAVAAPTFVAMVVVGGAADVHTLQVKPNGAGRKRRPIP